MGCGQSKRLPTADTPAKPATNGGERAGEAVKKGPDFGQYASFEELSSASSSVITIDLRKTDTGFGFVLATTDGLPALAGQTFVTRVVPGGAAEGKLQTGDVVVDVNGIRQRDRLQSLTDNQILAEIISSAAVSMKIVRSAVVAMAVEAVARGTLMMPRVDGTSHEGADQAAKEAAAATTNPANPALVLDPTANPTPVPVGPWVPTSPRGRLPPINMPAAQTPSPAADSAADSRPAPVPVDYGDDEGVGDDDVQEGELSHNENVTKWKQSVLHDPLSDPRQRPHANARQSPYQGTQDVVRAWVADGDVPWSTPVANYAPTAYTDSFVLTKPVWADHVEDLPSITFNQRDEVARVDRTSYEGEYRIDPVTKLPLNPCGRTGIQGRGLMGRFGPNHAADPIVTRWALHPTTGERLRDSAGLPVVEVVLVKRKDTGQWAIPGGMVDPGENVSVTLKREFAEEALAAHEMSPEGLRECSKHLHYLFDNGVPLYRGYSDDIRNTDNAWIETTCTHFHDDDGKAFQLFPLAPDAVEVTAVKWVRMNPDTDLFASHSHFIALALRRCMELSGLSVSGF